MPRLFEPFSRERERSPEARADWASGSPSSRASSRCTRLGHRDERGTDSGATFTIRLPLEPAARVARPVRTAHSGAGRACSSSKTTSTPPTACAMRSSSWGTPSMSPTMVTAASSARGHRASRRGALRHRAARDGRIRGGANAPRQSSAESSDARRAVGLRAKEDVARAMAAGFHAHLAKPASIEALKQVLTEGAPPPDLTWLLTTRRVVRSIRRPRWSRTKRNASAGTAVTAATRNTTRTQRSVPGAPAPASIVSDVGSRYGYCATPQPASTETTAPAASARVARVILLVIRARAATPHAAEKKMNGRPWYSRR